MELNFTGKGSAFYPPFKNTGAYMLSGKALYLIDCGETMFDVLYHKLDLASIEKVGMAPDSYACRPRRKSWNPDLLFLLSL